MQGETGKRVLWGAERELRCTERERGDIAASGIRVLWGERHTELSQCSTAPLQETAFSQMDLQKDIRDRVQYESNLIRVCCACVVGINLLCRRALVEADKALEEILASRVVIGTPGIIGEIVA